MAVKYLDVYGRIRDDITGGRYRPGDFLPTEPELMTEYGISRTTVRKAVALLSADGYVDVSQGRGTQVVARSRREDAYDFTSLIGRTAVQSRLTGESDAKVIAQAATIELVDAPCRVADALSIPAESPVYLIQRLKLLGEQPIAHIASYLDAERFPGLAAHSGTVYYLYEFLSEHYGTRFAKSQSRITAVAADFIESRILEVEVGAPLILQARVTESDDGPVEYAESFERSDAIATFITVAPDGASGGSVLDLVS